MRKPVRLQLSRRKGFRLQEHSRAVNGLPAVKCDRTTKWGSPFIPGRDCKIIPGRKVQDKRHAASLYFGFSPLNERLVAAAQDELAGCNLACWCRLCDLHADMGKPIDQDCPWCDPCHTDTLGKLANPEERSG